MLLSLALPPSAPALAAALSPAPLLAAAAAASSSSVAFDDDEKENSEVASDMDELRILAADAPTSADAELLVLAADEADEDPDCEPEAGLADDPNREAVVDDDDDARPPADAEASSDDEEEEDDEAAVAVG